MRSIKKGKKVSDENIDSVRERLKEKDVKIEINLNFDREVNIERIDSYKCCNTNNNRGNK